MSFPQNYELTDVFKLEIKEYSSRQWTPRQNSSTLDRFYLPSIDSAFRDSDSLSPTSNSPSQDEESPSILSLEDFDYFRDKEKFSTEVKKEDAYILTTKDMQDIESRVDEKLREDFKKIWQDAKAKELRIKKKFSKIIAHARSTLIESRIHAEKEAINRLEERAESKQTEIMKKRFERNRKIVTEKDERESKDHNFGAGEKWVREHLEEMAALRKIQSDLDRAKARRRNGVASMSLNKKGKLRKLMQTEIRRLHRIDEINHLIKDLNELGLNEQAAALSLNLQSKQQADTSLRDRVREERGRARTEALKRKEEEVEKLRQERVFEMKILEKERKVREEKERYQRMMAALARKAHNQEMRRAYNQTLLTSQISRSHSFTYFPSPSRK